MTALPRGALRVRYLGHATVLVELDGVRLLTDPLLRRRVGVLRRQVPEPDLTQLDDLDAVLISHLHLDHLDIPSLRMLRGRVPLLVVPSGAARLLARKGFSAVEELDVGERLSVGPLDVVATFARHDGSRHPLARTRSGLGYVITGSRDVYFAGDTGLFPGMADLWPGLDVALLPVSGWGPTLPDADHLSPRVAALALELLRPRLGIPIHWGTYRLTGLDLLPPSSRRPGGRSEPEEFVRHAARCTPDVATRVLDPGESLTFAG